MSRNSLAVEQGSTKQEVGGSSPSGTALFIFSLHIIHVGKDKCNSYGSILRAVGRHLSTTVSLYIPRGGKDAPVALT